MKQAHSHSIHSHSNLIARRGELMAELFLQSFEPVSIARPIADFGYDILVSFNNSRGGMNTFGVVVKAMEQPVPPSVVMNRQTYDLLAHSTIRGFLLVADVKRDKLFFAWPPRLSQSKTIKVRLRPIDEGSKKELQEQFTA